MSNLVTRPRKQRIQETQTTTFKKRLIAALFAALFTALILAFVYLDKNNTFASDIGDSYTVQKDDTLSEISEEYDSSIGKIKEANSLSTNEIVVGQKIIIPYPEAQAPAPKKPKTKMMPKPKTKTQSVTKTKTKTQTKAQAPNPKTIHIVKKGETVYSISNLYNIDREDLIKWNDLKNNHIYIGQKLKITSKETYTVKKKDTLHSIAKRYQLTVTQLKNANNLNSNTIKIGQTLSLPNNATLQQTKPNQPEMGISEFYTVATGDTLWNISQRFGVSFKTLKKENQFVTDEVLVGQKLYIPGQKRFEAAEVIGAADNQTVEFEVKGHPVPLKVAKGTASLFHKYIGKQVLISYKNGALVSCY